MLLERCCYGGLARGRKASEPDSVAALLAELVALTARKTRMPCDVTEARRLAGFWALNSYHLHFVPLISLFHVGVVRTYVAIAMFWGSRRRDLPIEVMQRYGSSSKLYLVSSDNVFPRGFSPRMTCSGLRMPVGLTDTDRADMAEA